jgi:hypothetical protein
MYHDNGKMHDDYAQGNDRRIVNPGEDTILGRFERALGYSVDWADNTIRGNKANREYYYKTENGE